LLQHGTLLDKMEAEIELEDNETLHHQKVRGKLTKNVHEYQQ